MAHSGKLGKKKKQWDGGSVSWIRNRMESKVSRPRMSDNDAHWLAKTTKSSKTEKKGGEEALENERERERISCVSRRKKSRSRKEKKERESKEKDRIKKKKERR